MKKLPVTALSIASLGAMSSLVALPGAGAAAAEPAVPQANSYADLLQPIPNATERLKAADAAATPGEARLIPAQYYYERRYYVVRRPIHRRHYYRRHYYYGYYAAPIVPYYYGYGWRRHHHHHHHHHHNNYY